MGGTIKWGGGRNRSRALYYLLLKVVGKPCTTCSSMYKLKYFRVYLFA